mmetsp:Transcript_42042/g.99664  ORF Transcript_42042/g.99664 Transcript_42042/m.99664 type:complete len:846 (+) Transcript_42042:181-2718(+)
MHVAGSVNFAVLGKKSTTFCHMKALCSLTISRFRCCEVSDRCCSRGQRRVRLFKPSQRKGLFFAAASNGDIVCSESSRSIKPFRKWGRNLDNLLQYRSVEALEEVVSDTEVSYEKKVAWLKNYYALRPVTVGSRLIQVMVNGARVAITWLLEERLPADAPRTRGEVLRDALSDLGPVFVKIGQTLATRPDLIGDEAALHLTQLQEKNTAFPSEQAFSTIRDEFAWRGPIAGNHLESISSPGEAPLFEELTEEPIAAASLGQVYKGKIRRPGGALMPVAVKVMRPRVARQIALDVHVIRICLRWLQMYWGTEAELPNISNEVGAGLFRELDYHEEARNVEEFRSAHAFQGFLMIPRTFPDLTTKRVLCMEWIDGKRKAQLSDREKLAMVKMGVDCCMAQLLLTGIIHADPHDGNMMLCSEEQLCLLDFGLITRITVEQQEAMAAAILHTLGEDWPALVEDMKIMGLLPEVPAIWVDPKTQQAVSPLEKGVWKEMPEEEFTAVFTETMTRGGTQRSFSQITEQLCELGSGYRVNLPTWLVLIIRAMLTLDGFAAAMDYNPIEAAYPHAIRRALSPVTQRGRDALRAAVLTPEGDVRWARLANLLGNDDALREASAANAARALKASEQALPSGSSQHIDSAAEAKRVVMELMISTEGKALRRLIYTANTRSILQRLLARDVLRAAVQQSRSVVPLVRQIATQLEARVADSIGRLAGFLRRGSERDSQCRNHLERSSWRAAAVYGVLARHHGKQLFSCGPKGIAAALGLTVAATLIGTVATVMAAVNGILRAVAALRSFTFGSKPHARGRAMQQRAAHEDVARRSQASAPAFTFDPSNVFSSRQHGMLS